jgi:choline dehydrogenase-like flavoprotein
MIHNYTFNNLGRIGDDATDNTQRNLSNNRYLDYSLSNFYGSSSQDSYVKFVRENGRTSYHPVGTCAMGSHEESVVSPDLKVHGIGNLRIADSSIMPEIVSSNTQAATIAIAERAADLILSDY